MLAACLCLLAPGCTNLTTRRAILNFADSLESQDLEQIRVATSKEFKQKALRQPEALADLKALRVPQGDISIVAVENISDTVKLAKVEIGRDEKAKVVEYRLALDRESGRWLVDDVILGVGDSTGREIRRSVTEQMNLILSCREFLKDWESAPRTVKLQYCTEELHAELSTLPPVWFKKVTEDFVGSGRSASFRPEARVNGNKAMLVAPHPQGSLYIDFHKLGDQWKVQNLTLELRGSGDPEQRSLVTTSQELNLVVKFLTSFADADLDRLARYATPNFYSQSLKHGELKAVSLPVSSLIAAEYESKRHHDRTELLLEADGSTYMLSLLRDAGQEGQASQVSGTRVEEVTIFEADGKQVKRISALLLSNSVVDLYVEALRTRNVKELRNMSSNDFNDRVWRTPIAKHFQIMPYPYISAEETETITTVFRGDVTEVTISQGDRPMTFILRLGDGWMVVDDVLFPQPDRPLSLKENLELMLPLHAVASGISRGDVELVSNYSGNSLNQIVWRQLNYIPDVSRELVRPLTGEVVRIAQQDGWVVVQTSDGVVSADVRLAREGQRYVIHDVVLTNEASPSRQFAFLQNMRQMIATGQVRPKGVNRRSEIQQVSGTLQEHQSPRSLQQERPQNRVSPAHYETSDDLPNARFEPISPDMYR